VHIVEVKTEVLDCNINLVEKWATEFDKIDSNFEIFFPMDK
jgi:hypothetical protein